MAITRPDETDLLLPLHEGMHEGRRWATFLTRLRQRLRADVAMLSFAGSAQGQHITPPSAALVMDADFRRRLRPHRVYATMEGLAYGRIVRADEPTGGASAWLSLHRTDRDFSAADGALLTGLAPHLSVALRTCVALDRLHRIDMLNEEVLRRAQVAWVALARDARVIAGSAGAPASRLPGERWIAARAEAAAEIGAFCFAPGAPLLVRLEGGEGTRGTVLLVAAEGIPQVSAIALIVQGREADAGARAQVLAAMFGLTRSEARLAAAIVGGASLAEAATAQGLTIETARNYSKRIFAKSRTAGQVDLVRAIGSSVARLV